jgi:hypothetical protein
MQVIANGADRNLAGVEPDANPHRNPMRATHLFGIRLHSGLHGEGGYA